MPKRTSTIVAAMTSNVANHHLWENILSRNIRFFLGRDYKTIQRKQNAKRQAQINYSINSGTQCQRLMHIETEIIAGLKRAFECYVLHLIQCQAGRRICRDPQLTQFVVYTVFVIYYKRITHHEDHILWNRGRSFTTRYLLSGSIRNGQHNFPRRTSSL